MIPQQRAGSHGRNTKGKYKTPLIEKNNKDGRIILSAAVVFISLVSLGAGCAARSFEIEEHQSNLSLSVAAFVPVLYGKA
jgi:hypothetical protein